MHRSTRRMRDAAVALAFAMVAVGCGDDSGNPNSGSSTDASSTDTTMTEDAGPTDDPEDVGETPPDTTSSDTMSSDTTMRDSGPSTDTDPTSDTGPMADTGRDGSTMMDGGDDEPTYRVVAISEAPQDGNSSYFALRFGGGQSPTVLPDGSPQTYDFGAGDIAVDKSGDRLFVLNQRCARSPDMCDDESGSIREVAFDNSGALQQEQTLTLDTGVYNPQGIGYSSATDRYYATSYIASTIQRFGSNGQSISSPYDTAPFDPDGSTEGDDDPEPADIVVDGDYVLVNLQTLDGFSAANNARIGVIDTSNKQWVDFDSNESGPQALTLPGQNSFGGLVETGTGNFAVGLTGSFSEPSDSSIVLIERTGSGQYEVGSTVVTGDQLDGSVTGLAMLDDTSGYAAVSKDRETSIKYFEQTSGGSVDVQTLSGLDSPAGAICLSSNRERLFVADSNGYVAYDAQMQQQMNQQPVGPSDLATSRECIVTMP